MVSRIEARESLLAAQRVGVGTGSYAKEDLETMTREWRSDASPRRRVRRGKVRA